MTRSLLFGAPYAFIPEIEGRFNAVLPTLFREVWTLDDLPAASDVNAWICHPGQAFIIDSAVLDRFPRLEVVVTASTGNNHVDRNALQARGIAFYSLLDDREALERISASVEMTFMLLLNALRRLDYCAGEVRAGRWREREDEMRGRELQGRRVGLIGLGRMGRRIRRYCTAFDADTRYYDPYVEAEGRLEGLEDLFDWADTVVVACSLTAETTGLVGKALLDRLPADAVVVNGARGEIVNEGDLASWLDRRPSAAVATDVLAGEVTGSQRSSPLLRHIDGGRLTVTPHIAGATIESQSKAAFISLGLVQRHFEGR